MKQEDKTLDLFKSIMNAPDEMIEFKDSIRLLGEVTRISAPSAVQGFMMSAELNEREKTLICNLAHSILVSYAVTLYNCMGHGDEIKEKLSQMPNAKLVDANVTEEEFRRETAELKEKCEEEAIKEMN